MAQTENFVALLNQLNPFALRLRAFTSIWKPIAREVDQHHARRDCGEHVQKIEDREPVIWTVVFPDALGI